MGRRSLDPPCAGSPWDQGQEARSLALENSNPTIHESRCRMVSAHSTHLQCSEVESTKRKSCCDALLCFWTTNLPLSHGPIGVASTLTRGSVRFWSRSAILPAHAPSMEKRWQSRPSPGGLLTC